MEKVGVEVDNIISQSVNVENFMNDFHFMFFIIFFVYSFFKGNIEIQTLLQSDARNLK